MTGFQCDSPFELQDGLLGLSKPHQTGAVVGVGCGRVRIQLHRLPEMQIRFLRLILEIQNDGQKVLNIEIVGELSFHRAQDLKCR